MTNRSPRLSASRADRRLGRHLLLDRIEVLPGLDDPEVAPVALHVDPGPQLAGVRAHPLRRPQVREGVARHFETLAAGQTALPDRVVRGARDADRQQDDRGVHDVAAVPAPVSADERRERASATPALERAPRPRAAHELVADRAEHERGERVREEPHGRGARTEREQDDRDSRSDPGRPRERRAERAERGAPPRNERRRAPSAAAAAARRRAGRSCSTARPRRSPLRAPPRTSSGQITPQRIVRQSATSSRLL